MSSQSLVPTPESGNLPVAATPPARPPVKISSRQTRHLAQAVVLEESGTAPLVRFTMFVASLATAAFVVWSALTNLPEVASAEGTVFPTGAVQQVQHLEGGIVHEIVHREAEVVEAGDIIVRLNPAQALADLEQSRAREATLLIKSERLRAFSEERQPDFSFVGQGYERLIADNLSIFTSQVQSRDSARNVILAQIEQKRADLALLEGQQHGLAEQADALGEEMKMREELIARGLISRVVYLDNKRELARVKGEVARIIGQIVTAREALNEVENRLHDSKRTLQRQTMDELGITIAELAQVQESLGRLDDRVKRLDIVSPVRGVIKGLTVKNPGAVVQPGGMVCEIVPVDTAMKIDARIQTRDVGHLKIGQPVKVKVTTYDFARYGAVKGVLSQISATTFLDEKGQPYFKGIIDLENNYVGDAPGKFTIHPGMTVQAEIITGDKTLLAYMLKPIFTQLQSSFHER
jgi:HlyD family secretion protein/adhesin transport system membrane fusion protein